MEIVEWLQFVKHQNGKTADQIIENRRKFIRKDENCIQIEDANRDMRIIPIDHDYLDYAINALEEFIDDAYCNDLAIGDKITFTFIRMSDKKYKELVEQDA